MAARKPRRAKPGLSKSVTVNPGRRRPWRPPANLYWRVWLRAFRAGGYSSIAGYLAAGEWVTAQQAKHARKVEREREARRKAYNRSRRERRAREAKKRRAPRGRVRKRK